MRLTATELSSSSNDTSGRAAGAADKSTSASDSVSTAAGAAEEMTNISTGRGIRTVYTRGKSQIWSAS